jgi:hypothetical protein
MTIEIPKEKWSEFFNDFSRRRFAWETILSEGLLLNGIIFEERNGKSTLEISVGENTEQHQTHNIVNPTKVAYLGENGSGGVLEIEEETGVKTLIRLINPMPVYVGYAAYQIVAA